jgi:tRNA uridine 5-carboxymethylaminomethyl modification enzyme
MAAPSALCPIARLGGPALPAGSAWREQLPCHSIQTNADTHEIIRANLDRAPLYNGGITSAGPRYCPSIETKIVRFAEKPAHPLFLEPEGWNTHEVYVQGANTSLPEDIQLAMLRTIPALRAAEIMRAGYAIEYDYLPGVQVFPTLETKLMGGLFLAGQIIGTTGYEEAAALGLLAGINAACRALGREPVVLRRDRAYIGVLVDDLVTKEMDEPYRMHTSQAEFRLLLRQENAENRLSGIGHDLGLISDERHDELRARRVQIEEIVSLLDETWLAPSVATNVRLTSLGAGPIANPMRASEYLRGGEASLAVLQEMDLVPRDLIDEVAREVETVVRYSGYVARQEREVERLRRMEDWLIPAEFDYGAIQGMRSESQEKLSRVRPRTVGQAGRVGGVAPSDISLLLVHLERQRRTPVAG